MLLIFTTYVLKGEVLTAETAFFTFSLFSLVNLSMCQYFPIGIGALSETLVSIRRIQDFLLLEEVDWSNKSNGVEKTLVNGHGSLKLTQVTGKWSEKSEKNTLDGISFEANHGQLIAIVGPVGSGKGSILHAILGKRISLLRFLCNYGHELA